MKKSELIKIVREELKGYSPQIGQTKGLTPDTLTKILTKIAKGEEDEVEEGMMFTKEKLMHLLPKGPEVEYLLPDLIKTLNDFYANHHLDMKVLEEKLPGLWANIRAKRARGEKPAHKNSNAHKDAVKAGKKINAMSEGEGKSLQDLKMGEKFTFNGKEFTFIELYPELENAARVIKPDGKKSVVSFGGGKVNTGKVAGIGPDAFGQGKGHHID